MYEEYLKKFFICWVILNFLTFLSFTVCTKEKRVQLQFVKKFGNFLYMGLYK